MQPEDAFVRQVQDVLRHLYDYPYLEAHPLGQQLLMGQDLVPIERMRALRATLLEAVEQMNPGSSVDYSSGEARRYNALNLRYVVGMNIDAVAKELSASRRQVYRDLKRAVRNLAGLLWQRCIASRIGEAPEGALCSQELVLQEAERLGSDRQQVDVEALLRSAIALVECLGREVGVRVESPPPAKPLQVDTDKLLARQALVNVLSHAIQNARPGTSTAMIARSRGGRVWVHVQWTQRGERALDDVSLAPAQQLIQRLGGQWSSTIGHAGQKKVSLTLGENLWVNVLLIDDDERLHELFRRYLADTPYRLSVARVGQEGLRLALEMTPDIIVLDVMMPQQDGWEILQSLQSREGTAHLPVIVCSVMRDPRLALSLGARQFVAKPVTRVQLLQALSRCRQHSPTR